MRTKPESSRKLKTRKEIIGTSEEIFVTQNENRLFELQKSIDKINKRKDEKNKEYDKVVSETDGDMDSKIYAILLHARRKTSEKIIPEKEEKNIMLIKEKAKKMEIQVGKDKIHLSEQQASEFSTEISRFMKDIIIEMEAKEQIARIFYNDYYYSLPKDTKRKIIYRIRKNVAPP